MSSPSEEANIKTNILPLSTWEVCHCLHGPSLTREYFPTSKTINVKRRNYILNRVASIPLAFLLRPLTLQEYFSFNLSPWCYKHGSSNLFLSSSHKNYSPYFSKPWQISTFDHLFFFFFRPCLSPSWLQTYEQFMMFRGGVSFPACRQKIPASNLHTNPSLCLSQVDRNKSKATFP